MRRTKAIIEAELTALRAKEDKLRTFVCEMAMGQTKTQADAQQVMGAIGLRPIYSDPFVPADVIYLMPRRSIVNGQECAECGEPITMQQVLQCKIDRIFVRNDLEMIAKAQAGLAKYVALSLLPQVKWVDDDECNEMYRKELTISLGEQLKEQANGRT